MITEHVKNWIKAQAPDYADRIRLGTVDANAEHFLGVYPGNPISRTHIAIGGAECTRYGTLYVRLLLRWGKSQVTAEKQAQALWGLFYGLTDTNMDGTAVSFVDPGSGPVPMGRGGDGVFEYTINLIITYMKE
jgi:hypothetical protein